MYIFNLGMCENEANNYWWIVIKIYVNWAYTQFHIFPFVWKMNSMKDNFPFIRDLELIIRQFSVMSREIRNITGIGCNQDFTI